MIASVKLLLPLYCTKLTFGFELTLKAVLDLSKCSSQLGTVNVMMETTVGQKKFKFTLNSWDLAAARCLNWIFVIYRIPFCSRDLKNKMMARWGGRWDSSQIWQQLIHSQFAFVGISAPSSDAKILWKYFRGTFCENKILARFLPLNLSQMLLSRSMGGTLQKSEGRR